MTRTDRDRIARRAEPGPGSTRPPGSRRPGGWAVALLLGIGLAVTWTGAVLFDLQLSPLAGPWPSVTLPALPDAHVLPVGLQTVSTEAVRLRALEPITGQALLAAGLAALAALLQLALTLWARATARTHEMAVRRVLGPPLSRLLAPLIRGSFGVVGRGLLAGGAMAAVLVGGAWLAAPAGVRPLATIDSAIALPVSLLLMGSVLLFGLLPAAVSPTRALGAIRTGARATSRGAGGAIVTTQVALAVALLYAGALQYRRHAAPDTVAATQLVRVDLREVPSNVAITAPQLAEAFGGAVSSPGAALGLAPRAGVLTECPGCVVGGLAVPLRAVDSLIAHVTSDALPALGVPIIEGRGLRSDDDGDGVVVNEAFVQTGALGSGSVVGRTIRLASEPLRVRTVVGVAGDLATAGSLTHSARPTVYMPWPSVSPAAVDVLFPGDGPQPRTGESLAAPPGTRLGPLTSVAQERAAADAVVAWLSRLVVVLGLVAYAVAGVGTFQATAASVSLRRQELGVRLALGATPGRLVATVASQTSGYVARGAVLSIVLLLVITPDLSWNPGLFAAVVVLVAGLALAGAVLPARAAAAVPPDVSLRNG